MRTVEEYYLRLTTSPDQDGIPTVSGFVFDRVWRFDFTQPGFCLLDLGPDLDSPTLRALMLGLKEQLSAVSFPKTMQRFAYLSMGRFDQQETTRFHLDGAPPQSLLMLGYEPSLVASRLFLADYTRCAFDLGITPRQFLADYNPMFSQGEQQLALYITEVRQAEPHHFQILLINNSSLSFTPERINPIGVLHKAEIVNPTALKQRVVNSVMLGAGASAQDEVCLAEQEEFFRATRLSQKVYPPTTSG